MKVDNVRPNIETSGDLERQMFSIQDQGMIFDILRNKMYSNPILAICREISCNARDAHREVGKMDVPVEITLPSGLDPNYRIKDFGPGISPDRMSNIFIKYTASTKRDDNTQTGGFGLGAKTPFSYSDTFTIITNYNGTKYQYSCFIDSTKVGELALMNQSATKDPNGTEIIIPVKHADFHNFSNWTEHACRHWSVKPIIKGGTIVWQEINKIIEGDQWAIINSNGNNWDRHVKLIIDGIEYPLDITSLRTYADSKLIDAARGNLHLYFGIGELSLSASREQVYLDKPTQAKIASRLSDIVKEIKSLVDKKIDEFPNLWEANVYYRQELQKAFTNITFLGNLNWKGNVLHNSQYLQMECSVFTFQKGKYSRKHGTEPDKLTRSTARGINFENNSMLFVNDLPLVAPTPKHLKKAFDDNPKLMSVQVICPTDAVTVDLLNKTIHLDKMAPSLLSTITKASGRKYTPATSRLLVFKFDLVTSSFKQVSYASIDEDTNKKVLCMLTKESYPNSRQVFLPKTKGHFSSNILKTVNEKFNKYSFYGVDFSTPQNRVEEDFGDFIILEDFIEEKILSDKTINYVEIKFALSHNYNIDEKMLRNEIKIMSLIEDPSSFFAKRLELHKKIKKICESDQGLLFVYESVKGDIVPDKVNDFVKNNPDLDIDLVNKDYLVKYPLIPHISTYNYAQLVEHIAQYINLIDKG